MARFRCLLLLPLFVFSLAHSLAQLLFEQDGLWIHGLGAFTWASFITILTVFTFKIELMVAVFHMKVLRGMNMALLVSLVLCVPLFVSATNAAHYNFRNEDTVLLKAAAMANVPFMGLMLAGCFFGLRDPYWPAAYRKIFKEPKVWFESNN